MRTPLEKIIVFMIVVIVPLSYLLIDPVSATLINVVFLSLIFILKILVRMIISEDR
ncbi:hypothetical protein J4526_02690 [Desulfurococcaceae archaeon MEX13E-LK6-19]|nr:hypothetical protein J4526_02690 [Desulfurococcaceae archaeon MEX13E-LK6-19]